MPTPLDRALNSRGAFFTFAGIVTAAAAWTIWGSSDITSGTDEDPTGDPENWTETELRRWLNARNLMPSSSASRADLLERVKSNMRPGQAGRP